MAMGAPRGLVNQGAGPGLLTGLPRLPSPLRSPGPMCMRLRAISLRSSATTLLATCAALNTTCAPLPIGRLVRGICRSQRPAMQYSLPQRRLYRRRCRRRSDLGGWGAGAERGGGPPKEAATPRLRSPTPTAPLATGAAAAANVRPAA